MIHVLTIAYGEYHTLLFRQCCLKSLSLPRNKEIINSQDVHWHVFTDEMKIESVTEWIKKTVPLTNTHVRPMSDLRRFIDPTQSALILLMEECLKDDSPLLFAPPDIFFGDGSINGLMKTGWQKDTVTVALHTRVNPSILLEEAPKTNAQLVSSSFRHLHRSWLDAELGHARQNQWGTGVCWQQIETNLYSAIHRLPTPYWLKFTKEDLNYFSIQGGFGHFDHKWPGDILLPRGRQRTVTSSDIAYMVEITEPHKNISTMPGGDPNGFWQKNVHNEINKQFLFTLRGA